MVNPYDFQHVAVAACLPQWPADDPRWRCYILRVTEVKGLHGTVLTGKPPQDATSLETIFTKHGVFQICLLETKPFETESQHEIQVLRRKDARPSPVKIYACPQRPALLDALADLLLQYEEHHDTDERFGHQTATAAKRAQTVVDVAVVAYELLRSEKKLSQSARDFRMPGAQQAPTRQQIRKAYLLISGLLASLTPKDYAQVPLFPFPRPRLLVRSLVRSLVYSMMDAFQYYIPKAKKEEILFSIAAILQKMQVIDGDDYRKGAQNIRKLLERFKRESI
jgi:hypothetical protein